MNNTAHLERFQFKNLDVHLTIDPDLPVSVVKLKVKTELLRRLTSIYYRPFSSYRSNSPIHDNDLEIEERDSINLNEVFYPLHYFMYSNEYSSKTVKVEMTGANPFYAVHDLLHAQKDVIGDNMVVTAEDEFNRLQEAAQMCGILGLRVAGEVFERAQGYFDAQNPGWKSMLLKYKYGFSFLAQPNLLNDGVEKSDTQN